MNSPLSKRSSVYNYFSITYDKNNKPIYTCIICKHVVSAKTTSNLRAHLNTSMVGHSEAYDPLKILEKSKSEAEKPKKKKIGP